MKRWIAIATLLTATAALVAQDSTLVVNVSVKRPVFNLEREGKVVSRTLSPGVKLTVERGSTLSGLGIKKTQLNPGTYYFADLTGDVQLFELKPSQVMIYNDSRTEVTASIEGQANSRAQLIHGNFVLAEFPESGGLAIVLSYEDGHAERTELNSGGLYKIELTTDENGTTYPRTVPW